MGDRYLFANEELLRNDLSWVQVKYMDGEKMFLNVDEWLILRDGIIENLYSKGLCTVRFRKKTT